MRRSVYRGEPAQARELFARAPFVHLAGAAQDGRPILRVVHGVVVDERLCFHAARAGEKLGLLGQPVVASTQEVVAEIPSYFIDPALACPATTYYRSAMLHGVLETLEDLETKAAVMQALMERFQPEGGHDPIRADDRRYRSMLKGLLIGAVSLRGAVAKTKLGQNRRPEQLRDVVEALWKRGAPGDPRAIEVLRAATPDMPTPEFLRGPVPLTCAPTEDDAEDAATLLRDTAWTAGLTAAQIGTALQRSVAWVGARDRDGRLVATARAVGDGTSCAYVDDVAVHPAMCDRGIEAAVTRLLLDHPAVRHAPLVRLTRSLGGATGGAWTSARATPGANR